eukprot:TRINITY_DN25810_c0_g1_i1.p1 TRINITY_DN25810_c0_g1~~TRINITY_DN25810_c0_g1_i1.p1  ORF type:complete len:222 (+),score=39.03 TRINITY_DN25810_c0_g1_i1:55-666(+)
MDEWQFAELERSENVCVSVELSDEQLSLIDRSITQGVGLQMRIDLSKPGKQIISLTKQQLATAQKHGTVFMTVEQLETHWGKQVCVISVSLTREQKTAIENAKREYRGLEITVSPSASGKDKLPLSKKMLAQMNTNTSPSITFFYTFDQLSWIELGGIMETKWLKPVKPIADIVARSAAGAFGSHSGARLGEKLFGFRGMRFR